MLRKRIRPGQNSDGGRTRSVASMDASPVSNAWRSMSVIRDG